VIFVLTQILQSYKIYFVFYIFFGLNLLKIPDVFMRIKEANWDVEFLGTGYKNETCISESQYQTNLSQA